MDREKRVGKIARRYFRDAYGDLYWKDFDIDFGEGKTLGKLAIGREFEILYGGRWVKTSLGYSEAEDSYYLDGLGYVDAIGMTARI